MSRHRYPGWKSGLREGCRSTSTSPAPSQIGEDGGAGEDGGGGGEDGQDDDDNDVCDQMGVGLLALLAIGCASVESLSCLLQSPQYHQYLY